MTRVVALIFHQTAGPGAGPLTRALATTRAGNADRQAAGFARAGATVRLVAGPPDGLPFGQRLLAALAARAAGDGGTGPAPGGVVVLGSGAIPLATAADRRAFVAAAAGPGRAALANNRHSADVVALTLPGGPAELAGLAGLADLEGDNGLPRRLEEAGGYTVDDLRGRGRLQLDLDGPLDALLTGLDPAGAPVAAVAAALEAIRAVARDPRKELVVAGRTSAAGLAWLESGTASRTRALVEERGLRTRLPGQRPARSVLGLILDRDGPEALGERLAELGDAALVDSRVLLAHRHGADEAAWPAAEDRYASDLLLPDGIADPWLRALTTAARAAPIPIVLGGHTLVGPGLRRALGAR